LVGFSRLDLLWCGCCVSAAAFGKVGMWQGALSLFYEMHERGVRIDSQTYTTILKALKTGKRWETIETFWGEEHACAT
jgi:pentatricopeptide repeat protein